MNTLVDTLFSLAPIAFLSIVIIIGYYFAWTDFKPKKIDANEDFNIQFEPVTHYNPKRRELTNTELGIHDFDNIGALSKEDQRRLKMQESIKQYSQESPQEAANVVKNWLSEL